jgi:hypothetical protein
MTRRAMKVAPLIRWEYDGRIRMAVVRCPYCSAEHRHVVPLDLLPGAPLHRTAQCNGNRGDYRLDIDAATSAANTTGGSA